MTDHLPAFYEKLQPLLGQRPWKVEQGWGSFLTFDFGKEIKETYVDRFDQEHSYVVGEWHLWIEMVAWRLETMKEVITASEDSREGISAGIKRLEGIALRGIILHPPSLETTISFEGGVGLRLFPIYSEGLSGDDWTLFCPDGNVLAVKYGKWSYHSATNSDQEEIWY